MTEKQTKERDFGQRCGLKVFPVSIGAMRLPDEERAIELMRHAIDAGMIYIDTSRGYGDSEIKVGKSLKDGYREKVILSTKWAPWCRKIEEDDAPTADCTYKRIIESIERLDVEYLDFYQVWGISTPEHYRQATEKGGMLDGIKRAMDEGLVKHTGFTTHDTPENVARYIDEADWCEAILFTHNMLNKTYQDVIAKAHKKGIATIVMNPVGGGMFTEGSPVLQRAVKEAAGTMETIETAHRYLNGDENIDTILCGISRLSDVESTLENYSKAPLDAEQRKTLEKEMAKLSKESLNFCTSCRYCMPCPEGIDIPAMMNIVYMDKLLKVSAKAKEDYNWLTHPDCGGSKPPTACSKCGQCEEKCTQHLKITEEMEYLAKKFCTL